MEREHLNQVKAWKKNELNGEESSNDYFPSCMFYFFISLDIIF